MSKILKYAFMNSFLTVLYIVTLVLCMSFAEGYFTGPDTLIMPIFFLTLFVFSAALTATLVLGRPISWYLNSKKNEAVRLLFLTIAFIFVMLVIIGIVLFYTY